MLNLPVELPGLLIPTPTRTVLGGRVGAGSRRGFPGPDDPAARVAVRRRLAPGEQVERSRGGLRLGWARPAVHPTHCGDLGMERTPPKGQLVAVVGMEKLCIQYSLDLLRNVGHPDRYMHMGRVPGLKGCRNIGKWLLYSGSLPLTGTSRIDDVIVKYKVSSYIKVVGTLEREGDSSSRRRLQLDKQVFIQNKSYNLGPLA